jgi:N-acetylglucosamine kinase-like BadF-type ATPase
VISGTGSIVYGRSPAGQTPRAGGWGNLLGEEGSGYAIGRSALRGVVRAADGRGPQTALTGLILERWSLANPQELVGHVYRPGVTQADIAGLAVLVEQAARQGDPLAGQILERAGQELAAAAGVVAARLGLTGPIPCAVVGGVIVRGELLSEAFLSAAAGQGLELGPVEKVIEPVLGAIRLAAARVHDGG